MIKRGASSIRQSATNPAEPRRITHAPRVREGPQLPVGSDCPNTRWLGLVKVRISAIFPRMCNIGLVLRCKRSNPHNTRASTAQSVAHRSDCARCIACELPHPTRSLRALRTTATAIAGFSTALHLTLNTFLSPSASRACFYVDVRPSRLSPTAAVSSMILIDRRPHRKEGVLQSYPLQRSATMVGAQLSALTTPTQVSPGRRDRHLSSPELLRSRPRW